jgi:hypothetical protein
MLRSTTKRALAFASLVALSVASLAAPVGAADPPGNNGTVKVDAQDVDTMPDHQPQGDCEIRIDFYGFDTSESRVVTFTLIAPTVDIDVTLPEQLVNLGATDNTGGGSADGFDGSSQVFDLNSLLYTYMGEDGQGKVHLKLTVHAEGAVNEDTKYKTFWVSGCERPEDPPV